MKNNPDLSVVYEVENYDADLTSDSIKNNEEDDNINISEKEKHSTVGYQETLKIDVKIINNKIKTTWRSINEIIDAPFYEETDIFPEDF